MQIAYPFQVDSRGRIAETAYDLHIRQLIEQVLFTLPGERVNRPTFGSGIQQLIFDPNSSELAAATQFLVQGALEQWLGDLIVVEAVDIETVEASLQITIRYLVRRTQELRVEQFLRGV